MPERFIIIRLEGVTLSRPVFIVCDEMTGRVRESTHDYDDANAIASWLNSGHVYAGGDPVLVAA